jgi:hypothetical protein
MKQPFCTACNSKAVLHASNDWYCNCDMLEHRPLGEQPDAWEWDEDDYRIWSEMDNPSEQLEAM